MAESDGTANAERSDASPTGPPVRWRGVLRDLIVVAVWVGIVTFANGLLRGPSWAYYLVVFGGILAYSLAGDPWAPADR